MPSFFLWVLLSHASIQGTYDSGTDFGRRPDLGIGAQLVSFATRSPNQS